MKPRERKPRGEKMERERPEFDQKVLDVRRTTRVVAGGRRFSFRATVVIGDHKGRVGLGVGKGVDVAAAVEKAVLLGKKEIVYIPLTKTKTIPYAVEGKVSAARVLLKPVREGRGLVAGGPIRVIADLGGIKDLSAKILGRTPNKLNNAQATMTALRKLK
ncbi:MAG: 30S ribosomal protein S5 [Candidatus Sungbacteria bacterium]|nr:30S ribosomal protein S5 [Candidatus Sungbacteria bacterium]